ncbi:sulfotransferase family protein [bacterium]|nr:sulfotransferase family protein [bacterium]
MKGKHKILAFSHIPKTAGTSFNFLLRRYFGRTLMSVRTRPGQKSTYRYVNFLQDRAAFPGLRCMSGHGLKPYIDYGKHESDLSWFTFFRNPEKRFISHYIHQQTGVIPKYKMDLVQWAESFNRSNMQVQWLAGCQDLNAAKQILDKKFDSIGITCEFDRSLNHLVQINMLAGFSTHMSERKMVVRSDEIRKNLDINHKDYAAVIKQCNLLDQELYDYALRKFKSQSESVEESHCDYGSDERPSVMREIHHKYNLFRFRVKDRITRNYPF